MTLAILAALLVVFGVYVLFRPWRCVHRDIGWVDIYRAAKRAERREADE